MRRWRLVENGALERHGARLIGANAEAIRRGEDRQLFKEIMLEIGLDCARSGVARALERSAAMLSRPLALSRSSSDRRSPWAARAAESPTIARSSRKSSRRGLDLSPVGEVLIEESLLGWKEFEMEVMRDRADNCVVICSIENFDPMGVHTGDSITVAPVQTLTDKEYQAMRDASFAVIRAIGVETGGSNIQFAVQSADRPDGRHRDEPARLAQLGSGLQGHRISDRQDRRETRRRLHARRAQERHHARDARPALNRPSTTASSRFRASLSKNSPRPIQP